MRSPLRMMQSGVDFWLLTTMTPARSEGRADWVSFLRRVSCGVGRAYRSRSPTPAEVARRVRGVFSKKERGELERT